MPSGGKRRIFKMHGSGAIGEPQEDTVADARAERRCKCEQGVNEGDRSRRFVDQDQFAKTLELSRPAPTRREGGSDCWRTIGALSNNTLIVTATPRCEQSVASPHLAIDARNGYSRRRYTQLAA